jgi:hypothetical protein
MLLRQLPRLRCSLSTHVGPPSTSTSIVPSSHRDAHTAPTATQHSTEPRDVSRSRARFSTSVDNRDAPPTTSTNEDADPDEDDTPRSSNVPSVPERRPSSNIPSYTRPPFHTHQFFTALEKTFPPQTARSLMRATRALLVDRVGRIKREGLTVKDLDNVCDLLIIFNHYPSFLIVHILKASLFIPRSTVRVTR